MESRDEIEMSDLEIDVRDRDREEQSNVDTSNTCQTCHLLELLRNVLSECRPLARPALRRQLDEAAASVCKHCTHKRKSNPDEDPPDRLKRPRGDDAVQRDHQSGRVASTAAASASSSAASASSAAASASASSSSFSSSTTTTTTNEEGPGHDPETLALAAPAAPTLDEEEPEARAAAPNDDEEEPEPEALALDVTRNEEPGEGPDDEEDDVPNSERPQRLSERSQRLEAVLGQARRRAADVAMHAVDEDLDSDSASADVLAIDAADGDADPDLHAAAAASLQSVGDAVPRDVTEDPAYLECLREGAPQVDVPLENDDDKCAICLKLWRDVQCVLKSACGHMVCAECLQTLFVTYRDNSCPLCRRPIVAQCEVRVKEIKRRRDIASGAEAAPGMQWLQQTFTGMVDDRTAVLLYDAMLELFCRMSGGELAAVVRAPSETDVRQAVLACDPHFFRTKPAARRVLDWSLFAQVVRHLCADVPDDGADVDKVLDDARVVPSSWRMRSNTGEDTGVDVRKWTTEDHFGSVRDNAALARRVGDAVHVDGSYWSAVLELGDPAALDTAALCAASSVLRGCVGRAWRGKVCEEMRTSELVYALHNRFDANNDLLLNNEKAAWKARFPGESGQRKRKFYRAVGKLCHEHPKFRFFTGSTVVVGGVEANLTWTLLKLNADIIRKALNQLKANDQATYDRLWGVA